MLVKGGNDSLGAEGYRLSVKENNITIRAQQPAGLFYGVQTLLQLFPKEIEGREVMKESDGGALRYDHGSSPLLLEGADAGCFPPFLHQG